MRKPPSILILIFAIVAIFLAGCISKPCPLSHLTPAFIGFSQAELDTIIVRGYEANGNFNHLLDTLVVTKSLWWADGSAGDTTVIETNYTLGPRGEGVHSRLSPGYDWEIYIPAVRKTIFISHIIFEQTEKRAFVLNDIWGCMSPIISYNQDGQLIPAQESTIGPYRYASGGPQIYNGYLIYIHK
jgi:hypothetical protein